MDEVMLELEAKANTNAKVKTLVADISKIIVSGSAKGIDLITPELLNNTLVSYVTKRKNKKQSDSDNKLLQQILFWQYCFYMLNDEIDADIKKQYLDLYGLFSKCYEILVEKFSTDGAVVAIPYKFDFSRSQARNMEELQKFYEAAKISIAVHYKIIEESIRDSGEKGMVALWVYHRDVVGNEDDWNDKLDYWAKCYFVYDQFHKEGMTKTGLVKYLQGLDAFALEYLEQKTNHNAIHKVDVFLNEAERLMQSAKLGTFPI